MGLRNCWEICVGFPGPFIAYKTRNTVLHFSVFSTEMLQDVILPVLTAKNDKVSPTPFHIQKQTKLAVEI